MQPDTDLCEIVILTQNNNNMLSINKCLVGYVHVEINNVLGQFSAARQQLSRIQIIAQNNFAQVEVGTWAITVRDQGHGRMQCTFAGRTFAS